MGTVRLSGRLSEPAGARALVIVIHGLKGHANGPYIVEAAAEIVRVGLACLRLHLRGADRRGEDIYHAGLTANLEAAVQDPEAGAFDRIALLGYSLGGHLVLRFAVDSSYQALQARATICPPLDSAAAATAIDGRSKWLYR